MMKTDLHGVQPRSISPLSDNNFEETECAATLSEQLCGKRKNNSDEVSNESFSDNSLEFGAGEPKRLRLEAPTYSDEERQRIAEILEQEFNKELQTREDEALLIEERIQRAQRTLQYLCYAVVSDFYSRDKTITQQVTSTRQRRIHPAVKQLLAGKHPKDSTLTATISSAESTNSSPIVIDAEPSSQVKATKSPKIEKNGADSTTSTETTSTATPKVPRYIPPKPKASPGKSGTGPSRGVHNKVKQRILIGNVSKWLPVESREDSATHKWMVYVRGPKDAPDISGFVEKVRFFLHPSYRPNDVVQVVQAPFHLSRRGWGEFPVRVQIHFQDPLNKPVDVIHHLKLDRTCTGLQTLGAETVVDVWINKINNNRSLEQTDSLLLSPVDQELDDIFPKIEKDDDCVDMLPSSPRLLNKVFPLETKIKTETTSPPYVANFEETSSDFSPFLQCASQNDSESTDIRKDISMSTKNAEGDLNQITPIVVSSPSKTPLTPTTPGLLVSSPSEILMKQTTPVVSKVVVVSSPPKAQLRPIIPGVSSAKPVASPSVTQLKPAVPVGSSGILISSPSKVLLKQSSPVLVSSPASANQVRPISVFEQSVRGNSVPNPSKVLILNRSALVSNTSASGISNVVLPTPNVIPSSSTKIVTTSNRLAETLQSKPLSSASRILIPSGTSGGILTSSGQGVSPVLKVVSPSKVGVQTLNIPVLNPIKTKPSSNPVNAVVTSTAASTANTVSNVKAVPVTLASTTVVPQNENVGLPVPKTPTNLSKPISLVKYKAPDGSIKFLQVSQINSAQPRSPAQNVSTQNPGCPPRPRQVIARPMNDVVSAAAVQRNPSPLIRFPAPANVSPKPNQGNVLMFRNGKIYLVRPTVNSVSPGNPPASTNPPAPAIRQPANQVVVQSNQPTQPVLSVQKPNIPDVPVSTVPEKTETAQFVPPRTVTTMPALVNTVRAVPTTKLMSEKTGVSLLTRPRSGVSLLKSNVLQQSPASSPSVSPVSSPCSSPLPLSAKAVSHRIIMPRPGVSSVSSSTYRTKVYKQLLSTVVRSCPTKSCAGGVGRAVRWMVRNLPLINAEARHSEYQILHPYCAPDTNTFLNWNLGKQRACEFMRAQTVWRLLQDVGWDESDIWTVREILVWARFHGYTPGLPLTDSGSGTETTCIEEVCKYKPIDTEVTDWLNKHENVCRTESEDVESSDEELDVVGVNLSPSKVQIKQEHLQRVGNCSTDPVEDMPLERYLFGAGTFVNEILNKIGLQAETEEIVPGIRYPTVQRTLVQVVQSLVDDLVRRSLAKAWGSNIARSPRSIELAHVCSAILSRPEFDFLSCAGMGVNSVPFVAVQASTSKLNPLNPS